MFLLGLVSCGKKTVEDNIVNYIENNCKQFPCAIKIKEATDFNWDKMFVFDYGADIGEIERTVGTSIPRKKEFSRKLVFTKEGNLVHYDELPTNIEGIVDNQVGFDNVGSYSHKVYLVDDAVFEAQKYSQSDKTYYQLKQLNLKSN